MVDPSQLENAMAAVAREYGKESIRKGGVSQGPIDRIPTGSLELDVATNGGIPMGRITRMWGAPSSGKSFTAWKVVEQAQKMGKTCVYYNVEKSYDEAYTKSLGVDTDKLIVRDATVIEDIGATMEYLLPVAHLHVIDSATMAMAREEMTADIDQQFIAIKPRTWARVLGRAHDLFDQNENAAIVIDQARDAFGYSNEVAPGGRFLAHYSDLTLHFKKGKWLYYRDQAGVLDPDAKQNTATLSGLTEPQGFEIQVRVDKSKVGPPLRTARMYYDLAASDYDLSYEYTKAAVYFQVVGKSGSWYTMPDGTRVQGEAKVRAAIMKDAELQTTIREKALA
jgi:protein RecA